MVLPRVVLTLLGLRFNLTTLGIVLGAPIVGAYLGAIGGLAYAAIERPFRRIRVAGPYLAGIVCVFAYLLGFLPLNLLGADFYIQDATDAVIFLGVGALFGVVVGQFIFRPLWSKSPMG
jgi:hypothetical protein